MHVYIYIYIYIGRYTILVLLYYYVFTRIRLRRIVHVLTVIVKGASGVYVYRGIDEHRMHIIICNKNDLGC